MNTQDIFTVVTEHLLRQDGRSTRPVNGVQVCAYYGYDDKRCAIGILIDEDEYADSLENKSLASPELREALGDILEDGENESLLADLQEIHDNLPVSVWASEFAQLSYEYDLDPGPALDVLMSCERV